jgi:nitroimidazol reductase NimA-like FMN-containing flavoprotein (pyridoxamine 5'-phosphate oxidase superfamily)
MSDTLTYVIEMSQECCADLLATTAVGRLGVIVNGHPEIFPVNHVYDRDHGTVAFPTNVGTKLRAALDWPSVAFEVDGLSRDGEEGWSVLVVGRAEEVSDPDEVARLAGERKVTWGGADGVTWLRIVPAKVTGRTICASSSGVSVPCR